MTGVAQQPPKGGWSKLPFHYLGTFYEAGSQTSLGVKCPHANIVLQMGAPTVPAVCPRERFPLLMFAQGHSFLAREFTFTFFHCVSRIINIFRRIYDDGWIGPNMGNLHT